MDQNKLSNIISNFRDITTSLPRDHRLYFRFIEADYYLRKYHNDHAMFFRRYDTPDDYHKIAIEMLK